MSQSNEHDFYARYLNPAAGGDERGDSEPVEDQRPDCSGEGDDGRTGSGAHAAPERDLNDSDPDQNGHHAADNDDDYPLLTSTAGQQAAGPGPSGADRRRWISTATPRYPPTGWWEPSPRTRRCRRPDRRNVHIQAVPPGPTRRRRPRRGPIGTPVPPMDRRGEQPPRQYPPYPPQHYPPMDRQGTNLPPLYAPRQTPPDAGSPPHGDGPADIHDLAVDTATALRNGRRRRWGRCGRRCARPIWCARTSRSRRSGGARSCTS